MTDPVGEIARATAARLFDTHGERLVLEVETELEQQAGTPRAFADPVSIAGLIVAIASLAWSIYSELRRSPRELADDTRERWAQDHEMDPAAGTLIDVVAEETVKHSER